MGKYIMALDQGTTSSRTILFDKGGNIICQANKEFEQIFPKAGWVEHNPEEIWMTQVLTMGEVMRDAGIDGTDIEAIGITNQRETTVVWDKNTGKPIYNAIVWQCARAKDICERPLIKMQAETIRRKTGLQLSPYFPAAKLAWLMENVVQARPLAAQGRLCCGTMDAWLVYSLGEGHPFRTDYSNASRTQLFDITTLQWDEALCQLFGIPMNALPEVTMSDGLFGMTTLGEWLKEPIPIHGVLGDSHGALFGQNCRQPGQIKATYGTGSSVMMNIGDKPKFSENGLVTSLAWGMEQKVSYVFEGNLNYTGAVISWLKKDVGLIHTDAEATELALRANQADKTYFVPAFTGLGAPYWDSEATGMFTGITRVTGRAELAKACLESIAYQITDLVALMAKDAGIPVNTLRVDGGPTVSDYLMQFQSDLTCASVEVPEIQELSGMGAAYAAGIAVGLYDREQVFLGLQHRSYYARLSEKERQRRYAGWKTAVKRVLLEEK